MREPRTVLLTWNPSKWEWTNLDQMIEETTNLGSCLDQWSVGRSKDIARGDRFYLLHLGLEPKGIMASGRVESEPELQPHWDNSERSALYVDIDYDRLFRPEKFVLSVAELHSVMPDQHWTPQSSGTFVREKYIERLDVLWNVTSRPGTKYIEESVAHFMEGTAYSVRMTQYERDPRNRAACLAHHGIKCAVCGFDFKERYGKIGEGFIHVHHLKPLGQVKGKHRVDPITDMRPVCPNCHAMLHKEKEILSIDELKVLLR